MFKSFMELVGVSTKHKDITEIEYFKTTNWEIFLGIFLISIFILVLLNFIFLSKKLYLVITILGIFFIPIYCYWAYTNNYVQENPTYINKDISQKGG